MHFFIEYGSTYTHGHRDIYFIDINKSNTIYFLIEMIEIIYLHVLYHNNNNICQSLLNSLTACYDYIGFFTSSLAH